MDYNDRAGSIADFRKELRAIEARDYSLPGDWTQAAIYRSCIRGLEIEAAGGETVVREILQPGTARDAVLRRGAT